MMCSQCGSEVSQEENFCGRCGHRSDDSWIGEIIDGRYRVLGLIGGGGMGEVYRIEHIRMGKIAAMKIIHGVLAKNKEMRDRFHREAQAISRLTHIHTVQVFDFGQHKDAMYLVMEYVRGEDLGNVLRRDGPMDVYRAGRIIIQVCQALAEAHERGVVHRDVKPENILLTRTKEGEDFVKIVDFGLARIKEEGEPSITAQGSIIGTPYYMSPEQARGDDPDQRTDIYSLGGVLYRSITGEVPYAAPSPMVVLTKCLTEELKPPTRRRPDLKIPPKVEEVVMKAMAKDPESRYSSAMEMADSMQSCLESLSQPSFVSPLGQLSTSLEGEGKRASDNPETWSTSLRLNRSDFDEFERSLRRRRRAQKLMIPFVLLVLACGATYLFWPSGRAQPKHATVEKEPNNSMEDANLVANGIAIEGTIGKRLSENMSDVDVFRFKLPRGAWSVMGELWPQRNMDLVVRVYGSEGPVSEPIVVAQHSEESGAEVFTSLSLTGGVYYAVVSEMIGPKGPSEGVSDRYRLKLSWEPLNDTHEQEPNDSVETSQAVNVKGHVLGFVNDQMDQDYYRYKPGAGHGKESKFIKVKLEPERKDDDLVLDCITDAGLGREKKSGEVLKKAYGMKVKSMLKRKCCVSIAGNVDRFIARVSRRPAPLNENSPENDPQEIYSPYRLDFLPVDKCGD